MIIRTLGTRGEIKISDEKHSKHSGILVDDQILFDLGEEEFLQYKPTAIFITHLHPDHAYFVLKNAEVPDTLIYAPEPFDLAKNIMAANILPLTKRITIGSYSITPIPTIHSKLVKSQAYLIEGQDKRILYTGDMIWIKKQYWGKFAKLDMVITDASYIRKGGLIRKDKDGQLYGHTGIPNLVQFFAPYTNKILFIHFGGWFFKDIDESEEKIRSLGDENLETVAGFDGLVVTV